MKNPPDIFISYSNKDRKIVHRYAKFLEGLGYNVWYDSKGLFGGVPFAAKITKAIKNCKLFIFFSSENSNQSKWTIGEIFAASKFGKPILPVKIDDTDYAESLMIILLPLHYIDFNDETSDQSLELLRDTLFKLIGLPTKTGNPPIIQNGTTPQKAKLSICLSAIASILFPLVMMYVSGEYRFNMSLSLFALAVAPIFTFLFCLYIIKGENWNKRPFLVNSIYLLGSAFFLSYTIVAFGLCFISIDVFLLNILSILCAILAIFALMRLMAFKKVGYYLLWICVILFAVGSYFWLNHEILPPILIAIAGSISMLILTHAMKTPHKGTSMWSKLSSTPLSH